ncbi:MAG TPA: pyridoxamine 5'-phosphate oxidase family protein [Mycobacteriales bacterium]|nr:pyridoxamine 5'-phosphate oxidase family protein [Mycobacteriales bacterium]
MTLLDDSARAVLHEGRQLHVGVLTTTGPHVTPELYAVAAGDIWFATAATTLKRRVLRRDPRVGTIARVGSRTLVVNGTSTQYDVADPLGLVAQARDGLRALRAVGAFTMRNAADLGAFARDLVQGQLPSRLPPRRVLVRLQPQSYALLDGTRLLSAGGSWSAASADDDPATDPMDGDRDCVIGWDHEQLGVLTLPARLDGETATAPAVLARLGGMSDGAQSSACVVTDDYTAAGPAAKRGRLLRGLATVRYEGALVRLELAADRETTWTGAHTQTEERPASIG